MIDHPLHYGGDTVYETIKVAEAWGLDGDAYLFNALKYISRAGKKDDVPLVEDLEKAVFYLQRRIARLREAEGRRPTAVGFIRIKRDDGTEMDMPISGGRTESSAGAP